jgi:hypothetical protein
MWEQVDQRHPCSHGFDDPILRSTYSSFAMDDVSVWAASRIESDRLPVVGAYRK